MKKVIKKRTRQEVLRLEISNIKSRSITDFLKEELAITDEMILVTKSPINMKYVYGLEDIIPSSVIKKFLTMTLLHLKIFLRARLYH